MKPSIQKRRQIVSCEVVCTFAVVASLTAFSSQAANPPNLPMVTAKAAAAVKGVIPGSEAEVQGTLAVVKKRTKRIPRNDTLGRMDIPDDYGVMFIIRLLRGPYSGPPAPKTPQFNDFFKSPEQLAQFARQHPHDAWLRYQGCIRTQAMQDFKTSNTVMLVEILFGARADKHMLEQGYAELTRSVASELEH